MQAYSVQKPADFGHRNECSGGALHNSQGNRGLSLGGYTLEIFIE